MRADKRAPAPFCPSIPGWMLALAAGAALAFPGQAGTLVPEQASADSSNPPEATAPDAPGHKPVFLQGGIEHSERLAPVAPQLAAGATYNAQAAPPVDPHNDWYWIPSWYAGLKHADSDTILSDYDFRSGKQTVENRVVTSRQDLFIGFQPDRNGQVWEFKRAPYRTTVEGDGFFLTMLVSNRDPVSVSNDQVVIRLLQTTLTVDSSSQRILKSEQQEQINTYVRAAPGVMNLHTSIKSFAQDGSPLVQEESTRVVVDRAPFQPVDFYDGKDMRAMFRDFMLARGWGNLLPDTLLAPASQWQPAP